MDIFQIYENTCKLRSHLAIPSNQNQNLFGWAKLRSRMAIPFNQNQTLRVLPDGRVWTFFFCFENFLMVRFFSFFFLMIRFDQTFHLMLFFYDFAGLTSVFPDCRVDIYPSWWQKLTDFSQWQGWKTWCFLIAGLTWRLLMMTRLIFSFLWDFPNRRIHLIFFPFHDHNHDSLLLSAQWFSLCPQSYWISLRIFL